MGLELWSLPPFFNWNIVDLQYYIFPLNNSVSIFLQLILHLKVLQNDGYISLLYSIIYLYCLWVCFLWFTWLYMNEICIEKELLHYISWRKVFRLEVYVQEEWFMCMSSSQVMDYYSHSFQVYYSACQQITYCNLVSYYVILNYSSAYTMDE